MGNATLLTESNTQSEVDRVQESLNSISEAILSVQLLKAPDGYIAVRSSDSRLPRRLILPRSFAPNTMQLPIIAPIASIFPKSIIPCVTLIGQNIVNIILLKIFSADTFDMMLVKIV